jgi:hypothetical protein
MADEDRTPGRIESKLTQTPLTDLYDYNRALMIGAGGFKRYSGFINNDYIVELNDSIRLPWMWREMREQNTAIASMMYAIESIAGAVPWHVEPGKSGGKNEEGELVETDEDKAAADFLESVLEDCATPWYDVVLDMLSCVTYGWAFDEVTYKVRKGQTSDVGNFPSKFDDGKVGWGKFTPIAQVTRWSWIFEENYNSPHYNEAVAIEQFSAPRWMRTHIPLNKGVHVVFKPYMGSPEGWTPLRAVFITYKYAQRLQLIMAQGADRDLVGYPVVYIPEEIILGYVSNDPVYTQLYNQYVELATKTRRDDSEGLVLPSTPYMDANGNPTGVPKFKFELLTSGGSRALDLVGILNMLNNWILSTLAADLLSMGHEGVGSFALADVKNETMQKGIESILNRIQDAVNTQLIPKLFELNPDFKIKELPTLVHDGIMEKDVSGIADYLVKLGQAGLKMPVDKDMYKFLYEQAKIPLPSEEALDAAVESSRQSASQQQGQPLMMSLSQPENRVEKQAVPKATLDVSDEIMSILVDGGVFDTTPDDNVIRDIELVEEDEEPKEISI